MLPWLLFVLSSAVAWNLPAASPALKARRFVPRFDVKSNQLRRIASRRLACETYSPPSVDPQALYSLPLKGAVPLAETALGPCIHHVIVDEHYDFVAFTNSTVRHGETVATVSNNTTFVKSCANITRAANAESESISTGTALQRSLRAVLAIETGLTEAYLDALADFGAIYIAPSQSAKATRVVAASELEVAAAVGTYVRVHRTPSRKPRAWLVDWKACVQPLGDGFLAVNKPGCIPMQASVDNHCESVVWQLERELGIPLWVTGRLDASTTGACVLATFPEAAARANEALKAKDSVCKTYVCLTRSPVPCGLVEHCFRSRPSKGKHRNAAPTLLRAVDQTLLGAPNSPWKLAALEVLSCEATPAVEIATWVQDLDSDLARALVATPPAAATLSGDVVALPLTSSTLPVASSTPSPEDPKKQHVDKDGDCLYEVTVRLITGRTHQIRLQLAALGAPLIGDTRYWPAAGCLDNDSEDEVGDEDNNVDTRSSSIANGSALKNNSGSIRSSSNGDVAIAGAIQDGNEVPTSSELQLLPLDKGRVVLGPQPELVALHCLSVEFNDITDSSSHEDFSSGDAANPSSLSTAMRCPIVAKSPAPWWRS